MANKEKENLLLLFERVTEPSFIPKGDNNTVFDVPQDYLADRYKATGPEIVSKFGEEANHVAVGQIVLPDLTFAKALGRRDSFSHFLPWHRKIASRLIDVFMGMRNISDLTSVALYCRDNLNPYLFIYAYSVALLHRPDTRDVPLPSLAEVFPDKFVDGGLFNRIQEEIGVVADEGARIPLEIPRDYTASDLDQEHRVAYFREDLGINLHHWHWHLVYPFDAARNIVQKDRRGELFYYMHQQIIARYNLERFSNNLGRVTRFLNIREPIPEGYFPKLDSLVASRVWAPRHRNAFLSDINREVDQIKFDLSDIERWRDRLYQAIHTGFVVNEQNQNVALSETGGIDVLGNIMEASILSVNRNLYGDMHNLGHVAIALCHDPDNRHLETFGVMGDSATAMRDPIFYRWHAMVDDIFQEHKATLPRYTSQILGFTGVSVTGVEVSITGGQNPVRNVLNTFWQQSDVDMSRGLDFNPRGSVFARFTHLQHAPFTYRITVENGGAARQGTCRIFLGPKFDERGLPLLFRDQKGLFIELDKFPVNLTPRTNTITRNSNESSVTIPFGRTFRDLDASRPVAAQQLAQFNFCGCGWPDHMLIPRGTPEGMEFQLFVMISDIAGDRIDNQTNDGACADAASFCGIRDKLYPDRRSMGFPFDRQPRDGADTLAQFLTPNMRVQDIVIRFTNRVEVRRQSQPNALTPGPMAAPPRPAPPPGRPAGNRPAAPGQRPGRPGRP